MYRNNERHCDGWFFSVSQLHLGRIVSDKAGKGTEFWAKISVMTLWPMIRSAARQGIAFISLQGYETSCNTVRPLSAFFK
ncbi:MAG: hypothetical protein CSB23_00885 [Deltaproteobacteria bacterium]|nr:MAG: hypothetical protein CSB23_00885 [Deltaproteobacteria bacterium]